MNNTEKFWALDAKIKERVPGYKIKFKDESFLMKALDKILFFNKDFITSVTTVIGKTVYFPRRDWFEENPGRYFYTLCHEYVHIMDYVRHPVLFTIGYLMPQALAILALGALFSFINPCFLWFLLALLCLAPLPSLVRAQAELRGFGMSIKARLWDGLNVSEEHLNYYVDLFTGPAYYFMWPFSGVVKRKLQKYMDSDDCLSDASPVYMDVYNLLRAS